LRVAVSSRLPELPFERVRVNAREPVVRIVAAANDFRAFDRVFDLVGGDACDLDGRLATDAGVVARSREGLPAAARARDDQFGSHGARLST
jgi:hypothetical protein